MGGLAKLLLEIVINNRVSPVFMVVNNCRDFGGRNTQIKEQRLNEKAVY